MTYTATLAEDRYTATIAQDSYSAALGVAVNVNVVTGDHYTGDTTVTPSEETQTLSTQSLFVDSDIIINPIPQNYGLITQIGSMIRIS